MSEVGNLHNESLRRKERLKALQSQRKRKDDDSSNGDNEPILPKPVFRSYKPRDDTLKDNVMPQIKPADVMEKIEDQLALAKDNTSVEEVDMSNLAPRKPDWDLKRDIAPKLDKLERRTQRAIAELIRERLNTERNDLVTMVNATTEAEMAIQSDDDDTLT